MLFLEVVVSSSVIAELALRCLRGSAQRHSLDSNVHLEGADRHKAAAEVRLFMQTLHGVEARQRLPKVASASF